MAIKLLRGNSTTRASSQRVLEDGQPLYEKDTNKLYVGDGTTQAKNLRCITTDRLKTSETRPKAEVKRGTGAVTKEIALLEDIGVQKSEWVQNNDNNPFPQTGWYLITEMQVANFTLAPFIAMVAVRDKKIMALAQDTDGYDVILCMTIGGNLKFADGIKAHKYTISGSTVTAQSRSLSVATLLDEGSFYFAYKFLFGSD